MPEDKKLNNGATVDWEGLTRALLSDSGETKTAKVGDYDVDTTGLLRALKYDEKKFNEDVNRKKIKVDVEYNPEDENFLYKINKGISNFFHDVSEWGVQTYLGLGVGYDSWAYKNRVQLDEMSKSEKLSEEYALEQLKKAKRDAFRNIQTRDSWQTTHEGVEKGVVDNLKLLTGLPIELNREKKANVMLQGIVSAYKNGKVSKEDFNDFVKKYVPDVLSPTMQYDVSSAVTNSILISGELLAMGKGGNVSLTGLKTGSKEYFATLFKGAHTAGIKSLKLMGTGAGINAMVESSDNIKNRIKDGEDVTIQDAIGEIAYNTFKGGVSAYMEGMSEGILPELKLGSIDLSRWATTGAKSGIIKDILANTSKKLISGLFFETGTEQITDAVNDIMDPKSHASAYWIAFGNDEQRAEALKNLTIEAVVGMTLGTSMGVGDIWSKKPIQEIEAKFGGKVAREVENILSNPETAVKIAERMKQNTEGSQAPEHIANSDKIGQMYNDFGTKENPIKPKDEAEQKAVEEQKRNIPNDYGKTLEEVKEIISPNILDYTTLLGRNQTFSYLDALSSQNKDTDFKSAHIENNYFAQASPQAVNAITTKIFDKVIKESIAKGLADKFNFIKDEQIGLKRDVIVGAALNFDNVSWEFLKAKHGDTPEVSFAIEEAKKIQKSDLDLVPAEDKFSTVQGKQSVKKVQKSLRKVFGKTIKDNLGILRADAITIAGADVEFVPGLDKIPTDDTIEITSAEVYKTDVKEEIDGFGSFLNQEFHKDTNLDETAKRIGESLNIIYNGVQKYPGGKELYLYTDPITKSTHAVFGQDLTPEGVNDIMAGHRAKYMAANRKKMYAVAAKMKDGSVIKGEPGMIHADLFDPELMNMTIEDLEQVVHGFIDKEGKFYTREEAEIATGIEGEAFAQNLAKTDLKRIKPAFQQDTNIPNVSFKFPTYNNVLGELKSEKLLVHELYKYLKDVGHFNETTMEAIDKILPYIATREVSLVEIDKQYKGATDPTTLNISLNRSAEMRTAHDVWDTFVHEALHSFTIGYMATDTPHAKRFVGQVRGIRNLALEVLNNYNPDSQFLKTRWSGTYEELDTMRKQYGKDLVNGLENEKELVSSTFSDTYMMREFLNKIKFGGQDKPVVGWRKLLSLIKNAWQKAGVTKTALRELQDILEQHHQHIADYNLKRNYGFSEKIAMKHKLLNSAITAGYQNFKVMEDDLIDQLDELQRMEEDEADDENSLENQSIADLTTFVAELSNRSELNYRNHVKLLSWDEYLAEIENLNDLNSNIINRKLENFYKKYKENIHTFDEFKTKFLKRKFLNIENKNEKQAGIFIGSHSYDPDLGKRIFSYEVRRVTGTYVDGKGHKRNTFKHDVIVEDYIPLLEEILGLPKNTFEVLYLDGFETVVDGEVRQRSTFYDAQPFVFGEPGYIGPKTELMANLLWNHEVSRADGYSYLYLGNFGGKNTLPVLAFKTSSELDENGRQISNKTKIKKALEKFETLYVNEALRVFGEAVSQEPTESVRMASTARGILEDLWFKNDFQFKEGVPTNTMVGSMDWNKIQKRGTKWITRKTGIQITPNEMKDFFGNKSLSGTYIEGGEIIQDAVIFDSADDGTVTINTKMGPITVSSRDLLINELGTPTADGEIYYLIGEADELHALAHGALKSGMIKDSYASSTKDKFPLFLKHAKKGVHRDSLLGQLMIQNNLAYLIPDQSAKVGSDGYKPVKFSEISNPEFLKGDPNGSRIKLRLSQWQRIKEEENKDLMAGTVRQLINGTAFSDLYNEVIESISGGTNVVNDILVRTSSALVKESEKWFAENTTDEALLSSMRDIILNPMSPLEKGLSDLFGDKLFPKEGETDQDILNRYGGVLHHAACGEALRNRLQTGLQHLLGMRLPGMRVGLRLNLGWANHTADVEPVISNHNLGQMVINLATVDPEVVQEALPEPGLATMARDLLNLQKRESWTHSHVINKLDKSQQLDEIQLERSKIIKQIAALNSERLSKIVKEDAKTLSPIKLINWESPKLKAWKDEVVWGKLVKQDDGTYQRDKSGILDQKTGRIRSGWTLIPEDLADKKGIKPGDWGILVFTPTDSPTGASGVRVAGVVPTTPKVIRRTQEGNIVNIEYDYSRKVADKNTLVVNSEWAQTIVGKDGDGDNCSFVPFDPRYWQADDYIKLATIMSKVSAAYPKYFAREVNKLFNSQNVVIRDASGYPVKITEDNVMSIEEIKDKYIQLLMGTPRISKHRVFPIVGKSFMELDSAYLHKPGSIISQRLMHGVISSLNLRAANVPIRLYDKKGQYKSKMITTDAKGNKVESPMTLSFQSRGPNWMRTHVNHSFMTHREVDFPNNTGRLTYNSDPRSKPYRIAMAAQSWDLYSNPVWNLISKLTSTNEFPGGADQLSTLAFGLTDFQRLMFYDSLALAANRNSATGEKLDYYDAIKQLLSAQHKLNMLATGNREAIKALYSEHIRAKREALKSNYKETDAKYAERASALDQQEYFIHNFIDMMEYDDIYAYPLFNAIKNIDVAQLQNKIPGVTFKDHLINQVLATGSVVKEYPALQFAIESIAAHAVESMRKGEGIYTAPKNLARNAAYQAMDLLKIPTSNPIADVRYLLNQNPDRLKKFAEALRPKDWEALREKLREFRAMDERAGKPYEPLVRGVKAVNVDLEAIAYAQIPKELDYLTGRKDKVRQIRVKDSQGVTTTRAITRREYWDSLLSLVREEAVTLVHGMNDREAKPITDPKTNTSAYSETAELYKRAKQNAYPAMIKEILNNQFLFFNRNVNSVYLRGMDGKPIAVRATGKGELLIDAWGQTFTHNEIRNAKLSGEVSKASELYDMFTQPLQLWDGIAPGTRGDYNRVSISKLLPLARNISMERRQEMLRDYLLERLYGPEAPFTREDQIGFWLSLTMQPTEQAANDEKATGFIVNRTKFDPSRPLKFQSNQVILNSMNTFEPDVLDTWLRWYSYSTGEGHNVDIAKTFEALRGPAGASVELLYHKDTGDNPEGNIKHYFLQFSDKIEELSKDADFVSFYKFMHEADWKSGVTKLRELVNSIMLLKALSENNLFYKDLSIDLKTLSDEQFKAKYAKIDTQHIRLSIERYMGSQVVDEFIRQRIGEKDIDFRSRGNLIALYWTLSGVKKTEASKNRTLNRTSKIKSMFLGQDLYTILSEKKTKALTAKDEIIGFALDPVDGVRDITVGYVENIFRTHATRTYMPVGEGSIARAKNNAANITLKDWQVTLNHYVENSEKIISLLSSELVRTKWRISYSHKSTKKKIFTDSESGWISHQLGLVSKLGNKQAELNRAQIFDLSENMATKLRIRLIDSPSGIQYHLMAGKGYIFKNPLELIETHFPNIAADKKLSLLGALKLRELYDIQVPKYIKSVINYLSRTRDELDAASSIDKALSVEIMIRKYQDVLEAIASQKGNYMPHSFPIGKYRSLWMKGYLDIMVKKLERDSAYHKKLRDNKDPNYNVKLANMTPKEIQELAYNQALKVWDKVSVGWNRGTVIPNFIPRQLDDSEDYTKTDPSVNLNYVSKLIEGLKGDIALSDWWLYQKSAREAGERHDLVELTKRWYADQIANKELHSELISIEDLKPGMEISINKASYILRPTEPTGFLGTVAVNGIVKKITKDEIILDVNQDKILYDAKRDLKRYDDMLQKSLIYGSDRKASQRQYITIQNLINKGYLGQKDFDNISNINEISSIDALDIILLGLRRVIANPAKMGTFNIKDTWTYDFRGVAQRNMVNRYKHRGAIEALDTKARELQNLVVMEAADGGAMPLMQYRMYKALSKGLTIFTHLLKLKSSLQLMGSAASTKAWFNNFMGAFTNNIVDAPMYNIGKWLEARTTWRRIKHGQMEMMDEGDAKLYRTLMGLGLTEDNSMVSIALEAANVSPEDLLLKGSTVDAVKYLTKLWSDAFGYKDYYNKLSGLKQQWMLESNPIKRMAIDVDIVNLKKAWELRVNNIFAKNKTDYTQAEIDEGMKKLNAIPKDNRKLNIASEQGITLGMATQLMGRVIWQKYYTSIFGVGLQAKAEKLRIPAFFIGYSTAIDMGFSSEEALQIAQNGVELRHAFYGRSSKQFAANTKAGSYAMQYAQFRYNAFSKAIRILNEMIPQMLRFAHNRPAEVSRLTNIGRMLKLVQKSVDAKGEAIRKADGTSIKEINLLHTVMNKIIYTSIMMQVGSRIFYGLTGFQDPVGQALYGLADYLITLLQNGFDPGDDDDMNDLMWTLNDGMLLQGLGYQQLGQTILITTWDQDYARMMGGRWQDNAEFLWKLENSVKMLYDENSLGEKDKTFFEWTTIDDLSGIKLVGWTSASDESSTYTTYGPSEWAVPPFYMGVGEKTKTSFGGRYVDTNGKGISGRWSSDAEWRFKYLKDIETYVPFLDRLMTGR